MPLRVLPSAHVVRHGWGRHPLVRASDRIEALLAVAAAVLVLAAAVAGGIAGAASREAVRADNRTLTAVTARVTDLHSVPRGRPMAEVRWGAGGSARSTTVAGSGLHRGDTVTVWLARTGAVTTPRDASFVADEKALATGVAAWLALCVPIAVGVLVGMRWLDRRRDTEWQDALDDLFRARNGRINWPD